MRIRRLTPIIILGLLHLYIGVRLLPDLAASPAVRWSGALLLMLSLALMVAGFMARAMQPRAVADRVAAVGLLTASLFSSLFVLTLLREVVLLLALVSLPAQYLPPLEDATALLTLGMAVFVTLVGFAGARRRARIVTVEVPLTNLPLDL